MHAPVCYCLMESPLGKALAASEAEALIGFWFIGQRHYPQHSAQWREQADSPLFSSLQGWLRGYFAGKNEKPDFPLRPRGTAFQQAVWELLLRIPYGSVSTYGALAAELGGKGKGGARAVGGAVGRNPISLLIPCHRVIGATGGLTGYAGGLDKKQALLRLEGVLGGVTAG